MALNVKPPGGSGKHDDPRDMVWVNVNDLVIDENIQREVDATRHRIFSQDWDWDLAEVPTVSERRSGTLVVTEGQHRVLRRKEIAPGSSLWVVKRSGSQGGGHEAAAAQGIAKGRKGHTALDQWDLRLHSGDPYVVAGDRVLTELGLAMGAQKSGAGIWAAASVTGILSGSHRTPEQGEVLLRLTLLTLTSSWRDDENPGARWEATMLRAVSHLIDRNQDVIDVNKLSKRMDTTAGADTWLKRARERAHGSHRAPWLVLAELLAGSYNTGMKRDDRKLVW